MNESPYNDMDKEAYRTAYLVAGYIRNTLTEDEHKELDDWVTASDHNMRLFEDLTDEKNIEANLSWMDNVRSDQSFQALQASGAFRKPAKTIMPNRTWIAAASVIMVLGLFIVYHYTGKNVIRNNGLAISDSIKLKPGGNRATLTLADGSIIDLTTAKNGLIGAGKSVHLNKAVDGELEYVANDSANKTTDTNILSTPAGGQYRVQLSDGTKVWLNAATILKYPTRFTTSERVVQLNGEAYFEVTKNKKQPFHVVLADSVSVTVLGTHFNVMAYDNEMAHEITLLEGSIAVNRKNNTAKLEPGMQAIITGNVITNQKDVDTAEITGWKYGLFIFHDASIQSIMKQVERWYDAKVIFQADIKQQFNATIVRSEPLNKLLHLLELNGYVHFKIENKTIYVLQ
jgi:transmembrane sensor